MEIPLVSLALPWPLCKILGGEGKTITCGFFFFYLKHIFIKYRRTQNNIGGKKNSKFVLTVGVCFLKGEGTYPHVICESKGIVPPLLLWGRPFEITKQGSPKKNVVCD